MKRIGFILLAVSLLLTGCAGEGDVEKTFASLSDFSGTKIGTMTGSTLRNYIDLVASDIVYNEYNSVSDQLTALSSGKIDALSSDLPLAQYIIAQREEYVIFPDVVTSDSYGFALAKESPLTEKANEALQKLKESGVIEQAAETWFSADESSKVLPELEYKEDFDGSDGVIVYGFETTAIPMSYIGSDGKPMGFDLDIISRIAYELNMKIEFVPMNFDALLAALSSGKVDVVGGCMSITEERKQSVDFIGPYYEGSVVLLIKKERLGK